MSSSLFHDCYAPYDTYPRTIYVNNDKKFGELINNDIIYCLKYNNGIFIFNELIVKNSWHTYNGYYYISCLDNNKKFIINFGPTNSFNVIKSKDNSIILLNGYIIGTNKQSIIDTQRMLLTEELEGLYTRTKLLNNKLDNLNNLLHN